MQYSILNSILTSILKYLDLSLHFITFLQEENHVTGFNAKCVTAKYYVLLVELIFKNSILLQVVWIAIHIYLINNHFGTVMGHPICLKQRHLIKHHKFDIQSQIQTLKRRGLQMTGKYPRALRSGKSRPSWGLSLCFSHSGLLADVSFDWT